MATGRHLEKWKMAIYLQPLDQFWWNLAWWCIWYLQNYCIDSNQILHTSEDHQIHFMGGPDMRKTNQRWRTAAILKNRKIVISQQPFHRFWQNLAWWCTSALWTLPPSWKTDKWRYICNRLTNLDKILHSDASGTSATCWPLRLMKFENPRWQLAAILKNKKSWYLSNSLAFYDKT